MATQRDRLVIDAELNDHLTKGLDRISASVGRIAGIERRLTTLFAGGGAVAGAGAVAKGILDATVAMEGFNARLLTTLGTQKKVNDAMAFLKDFAKRTPFELREVTEAFTRMMAYGLDPTAKKLQVIGDFAASMGRTFSDAVEAVADAAAGRGFERIREMGITQDMIDKFGQNLRNAKGEVQDFGKWTEAIFAAMAARSSGAMERLQNTIAGKWSNLKDAGFQAFASIGEAIRDPLIRMLELATKVLEDLTRPERIKVLADWISKAFSVDNMKRWATAGVSAVLEIGDRLALFPKYIEAATAQTTKWVSILKVMYETLAALNPLQSFASRGEHLRAAQNADLKANQADLRYQEVMAGIEGKLRNMGSDRRAAEIVNAVFNKLPKAAAEGKPADFGTAKGKAPVTVTEIVDAVKQGSRDQMSEMILGGGELARLGVKATELGPGYGGAAKSNTIQVNATGAQRHLKLFVEMVVKEALADGIRKKQIAVTGAL